MVLFDCYSPLINSCNSDSEPEPEVNAPIIDGISSDVGIIHFPNEIILFKGNFSGGKPETYIWDFGDGNVSNIIEPAHSYKIGGEFAVTLRVENSGGFDSETIIIQIDEEEGDVYFWSNTTQYGQIDVTMNNTKSNITYAYFQFPGCAKNQGHAEFLNIPWGSYDYTATSASGKSWAGTINLKDNCEPVLLN